MSDTREQRTPAEEAAERASLQERTRVDTWVRAAEQAWDQEHRTAAHWQETWHQVSRHGQTPSHPALPSHQAARDRWERHQNAPRAWTVLTQAERAQVVAPEILAQYRADAPHLHHDGAGRPGPSTDRLALGHVAGEAARQRMVHEQTPERSPEREARGWGQSWAEQAHEQTRGRNR